ncbi:MAG: ketopantoate reductase family protein [Rikenellaceae bacterium]
MNIVIVGLGAIGGVYATAFHHRGIPFRVALDSERLLRYGSRPFVFNGVDYSFDYFTPSFEDSYVADLIILTTKWDGYFDALQMIRPLVGDRTVVLPLLNGISSERAAIELFSAERVLYGYFLGHTSTRELGGVSHDGHFTTVFGRASNDLDSLDYRVGLVARLFSRAGISYRVDSDMISSSWQKFVINVGLNQSTAFFRNNYGEIKRDPQKLDFTCSLMREAVEVARCVGVAGWEGLLTKGLDTLDMMRDGDSSSMRQDVEAGRVTEVDLFAGEVCRLARALNILTPCNDLVLLHFQLR